MTYLMFVLGFLLHVVTRWDEANAAARVRLIDHIVANPSRLTVSALSTVVIAAAWDEFAPAAGMDPTSSIAAAIVAYSATSLFGKVAGRLSGGK